MSKLEELRKQFTSARHEPDPECVKCKGSGKVIRQGREYPCICLYIEDRSLRKIASESLTKVAREELARMGRQ